MYEELVNEIIEGRRLGKEDDLTFLIDGDLESLCQGADKIRKELCGNQVDLCTIINGRAGRCSENCRFCAQSSHHHTGAEEYDVMDVDSFVKACHVPQISRTRIFPWLMVNGPNPVTSTTNSESTA